MKKQSTLSRLQRLDELSGLLKSSDHLLVSDIAKQLDVSTRTVMRDLDVLREKGFPIETNQGRGGGIRLHRFWGLGRLYLNYREIIDLLLSLAIMEKFHSPIFLANLKSIRHKIAASFPEEQRKKVQDVRNRILICDHASDTIIDNTQSAPTTSAHCLYEAFFEMKELDISYTDVEGKKTERKIEPHYLLLSWPIWYVLAWDHLRNDARCFRLDRIKKASLTEKSFKLKNSKKLIGKLENFSMRL